MDGRFVCYNALFYQAEFDLVRLVLLGATNQSNKKLRTCSAVVKGFPKRVLRI
jgi:hypothetical protein